MTIKEKQCDLFTVSEDYMLVHCISADFAMGAGIAKEFTRRGVKRALLSNDTYTDVKEKVGLCFMTYATNWKAECNLITKEKYWQKPTYDSLRQSLENLCSQIRDSSYMRLAMPRIGCGLDRLEWSKVKTIIENVFIHTDIEILVCVK